MNALPALNCLQNEEEIKVHSFSSYANWLIPNVVMMGEHPAINRNFARGRIQALCKKGRCRTFVCLQSEVPPQTCKASLMGGFQDWKKNTSTKILPSYYYHVAKALPDEKPLYIRYGMRSNGQVDSLNSYDIFMDELKCRIDLGEVLYIHCNGNNTRTNIVAAGLLQRLYAEISMKEALQRTQQYYEMRNRTSNDVSLHSIISSSIYQKKGTLGSTLPLRTESKENDKLYQKKDRCATIRLPLLSKLSGEEEERKSELSIIRDAVHQKRLFYEKNTQSLHVMKLRTMSSMGSTLETFAKPLHNIEHNRIKQIKNKLREIERRHSSVVSGPEDISRGGSRSSELNNGYTPCKLFEEEDRIMTRRLSPCSILSIKEIEGGYEVSPVLGTRNAFHKNRSSCERYRRLSSPTTVVNEV